MANFKHVWLNYVGQNDTINQRQLNGLGLLNQKKSQLNPNLNNEIDENQFGNNQKHRKKDQKCSILIKMFENIHTLADSIYFSIYLVGLQLN